MKPSTVYWRHIQTCSQSRVLIDIKEKTRKSPPVYNLDSSLQMMSSSFLLLYFFVPFTAGVISEVDPLSLYFGGVSSVPPCVNGTYGGTTEMMLMEGDTLFLNCLASYPVIWMVSMGSNTKTWTASNHEDHNGTHSANIRIQKISSAEQGVFGCVADQNSSLRTEIHVKVSSPYGNQSNADFIIPIRHGMTRTTTTVEHIDRGHLWIEVNRTAFTEKMLIIQWWKSFISPLTGQNGSQVTKHYEHSNLYWSPTFPQRHMSTFAISGHNLTLETVDWVNASESSVIANLLLPLQHATGFSMSGNYTVKVTDEDGFLYYSKTFEFLVLTQITVDDIRVYALADNITTEDAIDNFHRIVLQNPLNKDMNLELGRNYLIVCGFHGYPISGAEASILRHKFDCSPLNIDGSKYPRDPSDPFDAATNDSMGMPCKDFSDEEVYGTVTILPPRIGTSSVIRSALLKVGEHSVQYGCRYSAPDGRDIYLDQTFATSKHLGNQGQEIYAIVQKPKANEVIIGDNVTLRCTASRVLYPSIFWRVNNTFISPDATSHNQPGYKVSYSLAWHSKILDLTIFNVSSNNSGMYVCRGQSSFYRYMADTDVEVPLVVLEPQMPYFGPKTTTDRYISVIKGPGIITMYCDAEGQPEPTVTWQKDGQTEMCQDENCRRDISIALNNKLISIARSDARYSGTYKCLISNRLGKNEREFRVLIAEPGQEKQMVLVICLVVLAIIAIVLAAVAIQYYRRAKLARPLKALFRELQEKAKEAEMPVNLATDVPANEQIESLLFDFRYEVSKDMITISDHLLGMGAFGQVFLGHLHLDSKRNLQVAVKRPLDGMDVSQQRSLLSEMKLMMHLGRHVNVLSLLGVMTTEMTRGILCAVLEYCDIGSLQDYLHHYQYWKAHNENTVVVEVTQVRACYVHARDLSPCVEVSDIMLISYSYQIANGMAFLASKNVVHRDLALRNILLTSQHIVKIADFGLAIDPDQEKTSIHEDGYVAIKWVAPECIVSGKFTMESDIWSYGVVLWEIFTFGATPYEQFSQIDERFFMWLKSGNRLEPPDDCPEDIARLMKACWNQSIDQRPSFSYCKQELARLGREISDTDWDQTMKLVDTFSGDLTTTYYNINKIVSLTRCSQNVVSTTG